MILYLIHTDIAFDAGPRFLENLNEKGKFKQTQNGHTY